MKYLVWILITVSLSACAIVDDKSPEQLAAEQAPFAPIKSAADGRRVEHGIITVKQVHPRSDIVILAPSVQHVVWQRDDQAAGSYEEVVAQPDKPAVKKMPKQRQPIDDWALLEEDMNFESEVGRVPMCRRQQPCEPGAVCNDLVPCERADELSCYQVKLGDYCVENK